MESPNGSAPVSCSNGHPQPDAGSRFCIYCGVAIVVLSAPGAPVPQVRPAQPIAAPTPVLYPSIQPGHKLCSSCGGDGSRLPSKVQVCAECKWLRPLGPGYGVDPSAFQWAEDGKAMAVLRSITPLTMAAQTISDKVGRRWIETTFNGVRLGIKQLPEVYYQAVQSARILGMSYMPDIYVSGELMWDCRTYGSDKDSFVVMGSALASNFRGPELLFLFAREMGHCRSGHALWKTVIKFLLGEQGPKRGLMAGGLFAALSPTALIEGTLEMPLLAWARQAEITADRAGLLVVGNEDVARRVLLTWSLKSPLMFRQMNIQAYLEQHAAADSELLKLSELMTSSTPYISRRLHLLEQFARSAELDRWRQIIRQHTLKPSPEPGKSPPVIRLKCRSCGTGMRVPSSVLEGKSQMGVRCPDPKCGKMTYLKKKPSTAEPPKPTKKEMEKNVTYDE